MEYISESQYKTKYKDFLTELSVDYSFHSSISQLKESKFNNTYLNVSANEIQGSTESWMDSIVSAGKNAKQINQILIRLSMMKSFLFTSAIGFPAKMVKKAHQKSQTKA